MRRGEVWTAAGEGDYTGKPRPVLVIQADQFAETASVTVALFTTHAVDMPLFRVPVAPTADNGLRQSCYLMADKVTTMPRSKLGGRIGRLNDDDLARLSRSIILFLGLAGSAD